MLPFLISRSSGAGSGVMAFSRMRHSSSGEALDPSRTRGSQKATYRYTHAHTYVYMQEWKLTDKHAGLQKAFRDWREGASFDDERGKKDAAREKAGSDAVRSVQEQALFSQDSGRGCKREWLEKQWNLRQSLRKESTILWPSEEKGGLLEGIEEDIEALEEEQQMRDGLRILLHEVASSTEQMCNVHSTDHHRSAGGAEL